MFESSYLNIDYNIHKKSDTGERGKEERNFLFENVSIM